ncbi:MAG: DUF4097 domain-containing protein [Firmicutes bacterium]|nr:DUF4097 domain-containing protein [Bacillota bacterium]
MKKIVDVKKSFSIKDINRIYIKVSSPNINLIETNEDKLKVHFHGEVSTNNENNIPQLFCEVEEGKINIEVKIEKTSNFNLIGFNSWRGSLVLDVYLPNTYKEDLITKASSGDTYISNISIYNLECNSSSGNIVANYIKASISNFRTSSGDALFENYEGKLSISTSSGKAKVKSHKGPLDISTSSGSIDIEDLNGDLNASTSSGKLNAKYNDFNECTSDIKTSSGKVSLGLPPESCFKIHAKASSGNIDIEFPVTVKGTIKQNHLNGFVGDSSNSTINIKTSSGNVNIYKL